jgi:tetratricopeptide (TPR) repeat protein
MQRQQAGRFFIAHAMDRFGVMCCDQLTRVLPSAKALISLYQCDSMSNESSAPSALAEKIDALFAPITDENGTRTSPHLLALIDAQLNRGFELLDTDPPASLRAARGAIADEDNPKAWLLLARAHLALGNAAEAASALHRRLDLMPNDAATHQLLGQAVRLLEQRRREQPDDARAVDALAQSYLDQRFRGWTEAGEENDSYATEKRHLVSALERTEKASCLQPTDPALRQEIAQARTDLEKLMAPKFRATWLTFAAQCVVLYIVGAWIGGFTGGLYMLTPFVAFYALWLPDYLVNKRLLNEPTLLDRAMLSGSARVDAVHEKDHVGMAIGALLVLAMPATMLYYAFRKLRDTGKLGEMA